MSDDDNDMHCTCGERMHLVCKTAWGTRWLCLSCLHEKCSRSWVKALGCTYAFRLGKG